MIENKTKLKEFIKYEKEIYKKIGYKNMIVSIISNSEIGYIYKYVRLLRYDEYYSNSQRNIFKNIMKLYTRRKRNIIGLKLGINIPINVFDCGLTIYHANGIVINAKARVGKNCKLHGDNCIGNDGVNDQNVPMLKDNVDIGIGAKIIGQVEINSNVKIGANAVVLKGIYDDDAILVGIPAKNINRGLK